MEKKRLKLIRKAHWNACQVLKTRLAQLPPSYSLNVNFARVNFNRLRPYLYLLVQQVIDVKCPVLKGSRVKVHLG